MYDILIVVSGFSMVGIVFVRQFVLAVVCASNVILSVCVFGCGRCCTLICAIF